MARRRPRRDTLGRFKYRQYAEPNRDIWPKSGPQIGNGQLIHVAHDALTTTPDIAK
jgi:hypothetical protein